MPQDEIGPKIDSENGDVNLLHVVVRFSAKYSGAGEEAGIKPSVRNVKKKTAGYCDCCCVRYEDLETV